MSDAVRGDFERLRRRLEGSDRKPPRSRPEASEQVVLTPPRAPETEPEPEAQTEPEHEAPRGEDGPREAPPERSRLRSVFRRR